MSVKVREIFASIQGEGPFIGYKQLFIRLSGCNLTCKYCDTDFEVKNSKEYSLEEIFEIIDKNPDCHSLSLTGGEPLLSMEFLKHFLPKCKLPVYLETNGTLYKNLAEIIEWVDFVSADIKLPSCSGLAPCWELHDKFFNIASKKYLFAKVVFDKSITDEEILKSAELCKKYDIELILQPKMNQNGISVDSEFISEILDKYLKLYKKTRVIPQVHKFLDVQ